MASPSYDELAKGYRQEVLNKLPKGALLASTAIASGTDVSKLPESSGKLSDRQIEITNLDATDLLEKIAKGFYTAEEVTLAFGLRAAIAHQLVSHQCDSITGEGKLITPSCRSSA